MSNAVSIFRDEKAVTVAAPQGVDEITRRLLGGGGTPIKRISIKGGKWRMMMSGEQIATSNSDTLDVVIVNAAPHVSRSWYKEGYTGKNPGAPDCWSNDGIAPDKSIKEAQHHNCAECPQNIKGSGQGESRACRHFRRLAVALAHDLHGDVYQLQLASKSIFGKGDLDHMPFDQFAKYVGSQGYNLNTLVTEMRFDEDSDTAKLFFRPVRFLQKDEWQAAVQLGNTPAAKSAVQMTVYQTDNTPKLSAPKAEKPAVAEAVEEPKKREEKKAQPTEKKDLKAIMGDWSTDDE